MLRPPRILLRSPGEYTSWRLACALADSPHQAHRQQEVDDIVAELTHHRGKTQETIDEMTNVVRWAVGIINPVNGCTAESDGTVRQVVGDLDDLEWALEVAQERNLLPLVEVERIRRVLERHRD